MSTVVFACCPFEVVYETVCDMPDESSYDGRACIVPLKPSGYVADEGGGGFAEAFIIAYALHCAADGLPLPVGAGADAIIVGVIVGAGAIDDSMVGIDVGDIVGPGFIATVVGDAVGIGVPEFVGGADVVATDVAVAAIVGVPLAPPPTATCVGVAVAPGEGDG